MNARQPWYQVTQILVDVAMGRKPADLVIRDGRWVNVHSGEILPGTDIAISGSRIAFVGQDASRRGYGELVLAGSGSGGSVLAELALP